MLEILANALSSQSPSPDSREGLPYWIFWFLLCVILLLVVFIFLRDKSLRQRLNSFFFSIKRKLMKIQLQSRLKKERQRKDALVKELGKRAWKDNIRVSQNEGTNKKLDKLEKEVTTTQKRLEKIELNIKTLDDHFKKSEKKYEEQIREREEKLASQRRRVAEIESREMKPKLNTSQNERESKDRTDDPIPEKIEAQEKEEKGEGNEEGRGSRVGKKELERQREIIQKSISSNERKIREIEEARDKQRSKVGKKIKELEKNREKINDDIRDIERQREPLFENLGRTIEELRIGERKLADLYSRIDNANRRIHGLEKKIQNL